MPLSSNNPKAINTPSPPKSADSLSDKPARILRGAIVIAGDDYLNQMPVVFLASKTLNRHFRAFETPMQEHTHKINVHSMRYPSMQDYRT